MHPSARTGSKNQDINFFNYNLLPACARSCQIFKVSEANCLPPAAPTSDLFTYRNCICQSDSLRSLHESGVICHDVCNDRDDAIVHGYYIHLCTRPEPTRTSIFISTLTVSSAAVETTVASKLVDHPTLPTPTSTETSQNTSRGKHQWFDKNGKYLAPVAGIIFAIVIALFGIFFYLRRNKHNSRPASQQVHSRPIALQPLTSQSTQSLQLDVEQDWHWETSTNTNSSFSAVQSPSVSSPFALQTPSRSLGHTIRAYAEERNEGGDLEKSDTEGTTSLVRSLSRMERLIRERIRTTGRPDIPISETPKITR